MKESWRPASEQDMKVVLAGEKERAKTIIKTTICKATICAERIT